jgi:hypothetical protein
MKAPIVFRWGSPWGIQRLVLILIVLIFTVTSHALAQSETAGPTPESKPSAKIIRFAGPFSTDAYYWRLAELIYSEAFRRLGYGFELHGFPFERSLLEAESGRVDGEVGRIQFDEALAAQYPTLIRVPEPVNQGVFAAYTLDSSLHLAGWADLGASKLMVGHPRGYKLTEKRLGAYVDKTRMLEFTHIGQGLKMLQRHHIDLLVANQSTVDDVLATAEFKEAGIVMAGILEVVQLYPYLHQRHRALAPQLAAVLKAMKNDGTWQRLEAQAKKLATNDLGGETKGMEVEK